MAKERGHYESAYCITVDSPEYESLSLHATAVFWALKFSPENNRTGIFPIFREQVAARSKVPLEHVQDALRELELADWIALEGRWVWLRNHLRFDPHHKKGNPKHRAGLLAVIGGLPKIPLVERFMAYYRELDYLPRPLSVSAKGASDKAGLNRIQRGLSDPVQTDPVAVPLPLPLPLPQPEPTDSVPSEPAPAGAAATPDEKPAPPEKAWSREACDDWIQHLGPVRSNDTGGRIGHALKPLVEQYGWGAVRPVWRWACEKAAASDAPDRWTAQAFARSFKALRERHAREGNGALVRAGPGPPGKATLLERQQQENEAFRRARGGGG